MRRLLKTGRDVHKLACLTGGCFVKRVAEAVEGRTSCAGLGRAVSMPSVLLDVIEGG